MKLIKTHTRRYNHIQANADLFHDGWKILKPKLKAFNVAIHKKKQIENQESNIKHSYGITLGEKKSCLIAVTTKTKQMPEKSMKRKLKL